MSPAWRIVFPIAVTCGLLAGIEFGRSFGITVPVPFLALYAAVVFGAGTGGKAAGAAAGAIASAYVVYCGAVGVGPPTLTATPLRVVLGGLLYGVTGLMLGHIRDQRDRLFEEARRHGAELEAQIRARTRSLSETVESLRRFEQFADNSADLLAMICAEGRFLAVNRAFCEFHGVDARQIAGASIASVFGAEQFQLQLREIMDHGSAGAILRLDVTEEHATLGQRFLEYDLRPLMGSDGAEVVGVILAGRDVTEARAAERALIESRDQLRSIADNLPVLIAYVDREQRYRFVNRTCANWFARPAEEILGKSLDEVHGTNVSVFRESTVRALRGETLLTGSEVTHPDGVTRSVRARYVPDFGAGGGVRGYYVLAEDVTEQKKVEERLGQSQKLETVGRLTGGIAHDFNNLLAVIQGNAELLARQAGGDVEATVAPIFDATKRGSELIQRLLSFSRRQPLHSEPVNCGTLVAGMRDLLVRTLREIADIEIEVSPDLWIARVDRGQLENALLNLAINARDAMEAGDRLTIRCSNVRIGEAEAARYPDVEPGDYVDLSVRDTGAGMTREVAERAFEPFFTTKEVGEGSGLGLSMVYGFARQSGGHAMLASSPGEGTTVTLLLPRTDGVEADPPARPAGQAPSGSGEMVLVIEDDENVRSLVVRMLDAMGYRVVEAGDIAAARTILKGDADIGVILSDVVLPGGVSGSDFAGEALRLYPGIGIVLMSGYRSDQFGAPASPGGGAEDGIVQLRKPFALADLGQALRTTLDRVAGRAEG